MSAFDADHALEALSLLDTVDLAGLNAEAELQTRVDRKYLVSLSDLAGVIDALPAGTRVLDLDGERSLRYASQYFDTPRLDSYFGAVHGRRRRFKVRARSYLDSGGAFLEVKTRGARSATVKERVPVSLDATADALDDDAVSYATELLTDAGISAPRGSRPPSCRCSSPATAARRCCCPPLMTADPPAARSTPSSCGSPAPVTAGGCCGFRTG